ncbi:GntR family transcriptional regulator [Noviherbaspirillum aerium]|uniref:GntR family transcriptional regulator n=1 Tax=Noviherbaspirillum aerium TaxID=2588497 RepID=UPI00124C81DC|nr:GntR family transcriptional regulator [Noviherbaspirillum aerium]
MATQIDHVVSRLRDMVLSGELAPGERIVEIPFAARLGVSRTPLRLALIELESEGLLERLPTRGYRVRAFSLDDIADAVDVRGVLEGMAARIVAERGVSEAELVNMTEAVTRGRELLDVAACTGRVLDAEAWRAVNEQFHRVLVAAANNRALASALAHNNKIPMAGPGALSLPETPTDLEITFVRRAQDDHEDLLSAIMQREGARAEAVMREHAYRSRENKRILIARIQDEAANNNTAPHTRRREASLQE